MSASRASILWLIIAGSVGYTAVENFLTPPAKAVTAAESANPAETHSLELELSSRYVIGLWSMKRSDARQFIPLVAPLVSFATTPVEQLRLATVLGEVEGGPAALARINDIYPIRDPAIRADVDALRQIYTAGVDSLSADQRQRLLSRHRWFGQLALAFHAAPGSPADTAAIAPARRTLQVLGGFSFALLVAFSVGLVLFGMAVYRLCRGNVLRAFFPPAKNAGALLEAFTLYVAAMAGAIALFRHWAGPGGVWGFILSLVVMVGIAATGILWPMLRGMRFAEWRQAVGWHAGHGIRREIGVGIAAYIGGLPILAVGIFITFFLSKFASTPATHPIVRMLGQSPARTAELLLFASVFAPIAEETLFRGTLFAHLRSRHGWLISATIVSVIFASLHPQGWVAMPVLFAMAMVFAAVREWRGSILPSMAAHCLNNTLLLLLLTVCLS